MGPRSIVFVFLFTIAKGRPGAVVRALTESPGRGFEAASPQILRGEGLPRFFPSPDPTHVGASGTGSASLMFLVINENSTFEIF